MPFIKKNLSNYLIALLIISILSIMSFLMYANLELKPDLAASGDAVKYIEMSKHTFAKVDNPFALRILSPFLVKTLSTLFNTDINFPWQLLTLVASISSVMVFFHILFKYFKLTFFNSILFCVALSYTYSYTLFNYADFWLVDPLNNLFFMLGIYFLISRRYRFFLFITLLGAINKEIVIFLLPLYPLRVYLDQGATKSKRFRQAVLWSLVAFALYIGFRFTVSKIINAGIEYSLFNQTEGRGFIENIRFSVSLIKNQMSVFTVFDFFWIFFFYSMYLILKTFGAMNWYFISAAYIFVILFLSRFFATDVERVFVTMAPFVFILSALLFANRNSAEDKKWLVLIIFIYIASNLGWIASDQFVLANVAVLIIFATIFKNIDSSFANDQKILKRLA